MQKADGPASEKSGSVTESATGKLHGPAATLRHERKFVLLLCLLGAIHVFIFSAAFPFFNNVDEVQHFDLVLKYAHGGAPRKMENISTDSANYVALMNSYAYFGVPALFPNGKLPAPLWTEPDEQKEQDLAEKSAGWQRLPNYEVSQAPLYYALVGLWWYAGQWLGFHDGRLLYWLRFFNVILVAALIWCAYITARTVFPENPFMQLGVPALPALIPQTAFYSIGNDTLSAVCFGVTFIFLLKWLFSEKPSILLGALTGLAFAATYLSKTTNLPLLVVVSAAIFIKICQDARQHKFRTNSPALAAFLCCAEPPIICWIIWCKSNFGDLTGTIIKTQFLGWTIKPLTDWWQHPIFTPCGFWKFLDGNLATFWQGEFVWHHKPLVLPGTSAIYTIFSLVLLVAALPALLPRFSNINPRQCYALRLSLACFTAALGFFALISIIYDFGDCIYPSRINPYFTSGRLLLGTLIPFSLLFIFGMDRALNRLGNAAKFIALTMMASAILALEIATDWPVFSNEYNWFHLL
jgi:hypothetical protein